MIERIQLRYLDVIISMSYISDPASYVFLFLLVGVLLDKTTTAIAMGKAFGTLGVHIKHIVTYSLSPFEQRAFGGILRHGIPNVIRRFFDEVFYILPGLTTAGLVYHYGTKDFHRRNRKNPADYENDE